MKKQLLKIMCGMMAISLMLQLCGCGEKVLISSEGGNTTTTTSSTSGELISGGFQTVDSPEKSDYKLPEVTLENKHLKIYVGIHEDESDWHSKYKDLPTATDIFQQQYGGTYEFIKTNWADYNNSLLTMYLADDMPDLLYNVPWKFPKTYLSNFVQAVDEYPEYINLNDSIWDDTRSATEQYKINGKIYYPVSGYAKPVMVMYNPSLFELNDMETPLSIYKRNPEEWTWNKLLEIAKSLTVEKNGKITQYGFGIAGEGPAIFQYSTGVPVASYDASSKKVTHNLKSPQIAAACNFVYDMNNKHKCISNVRADEMRPEFINGKIAMIADYTWTAESTFAELWEDNLIECVPFPRYNASSPNYVDGRWTAWTIASKAKNPEAAALYITIAKYVASSAYYADRSTTELYVKYAYNDKVNIPREQSDLIYEIETDYNTYPRVDGCIGPGLYDKGQYYLITSEIMTKPWSQIVEEIYPSLNAALEENINAW